MSRLVIVLLVCATAAIAGCNTISGFGRDVEAVGGGVSTDSAAKKR